MKSSLNPSYQLNPLFIGLNPSNKTSFNSPTKTLFFAVFVLLFLSSSSSSIISLIGIYLLLFKPLLVCAIKIHKIN